MLGTVLSLIAIVLANPEREPEKPDAPEYTLPDLDEDAVPPELKPTPVPEPEAVPDPDPVLVELRADGKFGVPGGDRVFDSVKDLVAEFGGAPGSKRTPVSLTNASDDVDRAALQKILTEVAGKIDLRIDYRAPGNG